MATRTRGINSSTPSPPQGITSWKNHGYTNSLLGWRLLLLGSIRLEAIAIRLEVITILQVKNLKPASILQTLSASQSLSSGRKRVAQARTPSQGVEDSSLQL